MVHSKDDRGLGQRVVRAVGAASCPAMPAPPHSRLFLSTKVANATQPVRVGAQCADLLVASMILASQEARSAEPRTQGGVGSNEGLCQAV